jgi:hypothetical protein
VYVCVGGGGSRRGKREKGALAGIVQVKEVARETDT